MSVNITTSFVEQYSANVSLLAQQTGSKLRSAVDVESVRGKNAFFDQVGVTAAQLKTSRHSDTPQIDFLKIVDFKLVKLLGNLLRQSAAKLYNLKGIKKVQRLDVEETIIHPRKPNTINSEDIVRAV